MTIPTTREGRKIRVECPLCKSVQGIMATVDLWGESLYVLCNSCKRESRIDLHEYIFELVEDKIAEQERE